MEPLWIIVGLVVGALIVFLIMRPHMRVVQKLDLKVIKENEKNLARKTEIENQITQLNNTLNATNNMLVTSQENLDKFNNNIEVIKEKTVEAFEVAAEKEREHYLSAQEEAETEYEEVLHDLCNDLIFKTREHKETISNLNATLESLKAKIIAINESFRRTEEEQNKIKFYTLQIPELDLEEINELREIGKRLRDPAPLNKLIWTYYYKNPCNDLCGRVIGDGASTGIYKIVNLINGKVYIGQTVNFKQRLTTHIKTGLGAETPTRNKLYPAMAEYGVENFSYEVLEVCKSSELNEREKFYIDFYDSCNNGYNSTKGGS